MFSCYISYIAESLTKTTPGSFISLGFFVLFIAVAIACGAFGFYRGFAKSVIRVLSVGISAFAALFASLWTSDLMVGLILGGGAENGKDLIEMYYPPLLDTLPITVVDILSELQTETMAILIMLIVCLAVLPVLFIIIFALLTAATIPLYLLLSGLTGAISIGQTWVERVVGVTVGALEGILITAIMLLPLSGVCTVAKDARQTLVESDETGVIEKAYVEFIDDVIDNPLFETLNKFGGAAAYKEMTTVKINDHDLDMTVECESFFKLTAQALPFLNPEFNWESPSDVEREAFDHVVVNVGDNHLVAGLMSDVMRGLAKSVKSGNTQLPFESANLVLMSDVMSVFETSQAENVEDDLRTVVDIYYIMCDRNMLSAFQEGNKDALRELMAKKDENGETAIEEIIDCLNENERMAPIVTTFTRLTITILHESMGLEGDSEKVYDNIKEPIKNVLTLKKDDEKYAGNEDAYKADVKTELDTALRDNGIHIEDDIQDAMVDYIADNYGSGDKEITDKEINDALLSYFKAYSDTKGDGEVLPDNDSNTYTVTVVDQDGKTVEGVKVYMTDTSFAGAAASTGADGNAVLRVEKDTVLVNIRIMEVPEGYAVPSGLIHGTFAENSFTATIVVQKISDN